jgi:hypothetical protein
MISRETVVKEIADLLAAHRLAARQRMARERAYRNFAATILDDRQRFSSPTRALALAIRAA